MREAVRLKMPSEIEAVKITWANAGDARRELTEFKEIIAFLSGYKAARFVAESMGTKPWTEFPAEPDFTYFLSLCEDLSTKTAE